MKNLCKAQMRLRSLTITFCFMIFKVQLVVLIGVVPFGAELRIVLKINFYCVVDSLKEQAHVLTNHHRVSTRFSSSLKFYGQRHCPGKSTTF